MRLSCCVQEEKQLLEDLYSITGDELIPQTETFDIHQFEESADARESMRLQVALPKDAPPIGSVLTAFAQPTITAVEPAGKRLNAEGVMAVTLIYLPMDSDIPMAVRSREPFEMTFPMEAADGSADTGACHRGNARPGRRATARRCAASFRCTCQTRRAADGGDCRCGAAPGGETGARLCAGLARKRRNALADGQTAARRRRRTASGGERRRVGVSPMKAIQGRESVLLLGKKTGWETQKRQVSAWRRDKRLHDSDRQKMRR